MPRQALPCLSRHAGCEDDGERTVSLDLTSFAGLALYARLLVLLLGTLLYGFVTRELMRSPAVLPGNRPMRLLVVLLTLGYAGGLVDELLRILLGGLTAASMSAASYGAAAGPVAILRGIVWLVAFPVLAHGVWRILPEAAAGKSRPSPLWLVAPYGMLFAFVPALARYAADPHARFEDAAWALFPLVALHTSLSCVVVARLVLFALGDREDRGLVGFMRALLGTLFGMALLNLLGSLWPSGALRGWLWQLSTLVLWLALGVTLIYFVQRYNVLRLSLGFRSIRHFVNVVAAVLIAMLSAPAVTGQEAAGRFVAFTIVLALATLLLGRPVADGFARRFRFARRLFGQPVGPEAIEQLLTRVRSLEENDAALFALVSRELSAWLSTPVSLGAGNALPTADAALVDTHFAAGGRAFTRIDPPNSELLSALVRNDLHAVFPLRVAGSVEARLLVSVGPTGGGYSAAELSAVEVVLSQTATILELRRLASARLAGERLLAERERLSMLGLTAASLAHEVKNPLSAMKAITQTVREELPEGGAHAKDLDLVLEQIDRLSRVTADVLGFARSGEGEPVDLPRLLTSAVAVLAPEARSQGVSLTLAVGELPRETPGSVGAWQTITFNLLVNAIRHAPRGTVVEVTLEATATGVRFETVNAGPAIPADVAERLFAPFATGGEGTGLGLALVKSRVEELGGRVEVANVEGRVVFGVLV